MRIILIYDLPTIEDEDRKVYQKFVKELKKIGFHMLQFSVYSKVIQNDTSYKQNITKLNKIVPNKGSIIVIKVTEKQYQDMIFLTGIKNKYEMFVGGNEFIYFGGDDT